MLLKKSTVLTTFVVFFFKVQNARYNTYMEFKTRLIELRKFKNISQKELAKQTGITQAAISLWERGERQPNSNAILPLCRFFDVSLDYLLGNSDDFGNIQHSDQKEELTPGERELIEKYRELSAAGKQQAAALIDSVSKYEKQVSKSGVKIG